MIFRVEGVAGWAVSGFRFAVSGFGFRVQDSIKPLTRLRGPTSQDENGERDFDGRDPQQ